MEVQVKDLHPNPFRNIERYKIDREKVESLKTSIEETTFWDNILARPNGTGYELAYGHHRMVGLQELGFETLDIPVRELDDSTMLRIMANENLADWSTSPGVINETVFAAKTFLDGELGKCEGWDKCPDKSIKALFNGKKGDFQHCKNHGVGRDTILKFLGGNWKQWMIQEALAVLADEGKEVKREEERKLQDELNKKRKQEEKQLQKEKDLERREKLEKQLKATTKKAKETKARVREQEKESNGEIDREAFESFDAQSTAGAFRKAVKEYKIPKAKQKEVAKQLEGKGRRDIPNIVKKFRPEKAHERQDPKSNDIRILEMAFKAIDEDAMKLKNKIVNFTLKLEEMKVTQLSGLDAVFTYKAIKDLLASIAELSKFYGIDQLDDGDTKHGK